LHGDNPDYLYPLLKYQAVWAKYIFHFTLIL
jgi:hypothetical protein